MMLRIQIIQFKIGVWLLDKFVRKQFEIHQNQHNADFEVCPRCPRVILLIDRIGQWLAQ